VGTKNSCCANKKLGHLVAFFGTKNCGCANKNLELKITSMPAKKKKLNCWKKLWVW
jgi:hypothetical protein